MSDTAREPKTAALRLLAIIGVAALLIAAAFYFIKFAPGHWFQLSADPEDWERFGAYLGGTLGPIYGLLAFLGVLATLVLQNRQLDVARTQLSLAEFAGLLAQNAKDIDSILQEQPYIIPPVGENLHLAGMKSSLSMLLRAVGENATGPPERQADFANIRYAIVESVEPYVGELVVQLQHLVRNLNHYKTLGGTQGVVDYYRARFKVLAAWIKLTGLTNSDLVNSYFDPDEYIRFARANYAKRRSICL